MSGKYNNHDTAEPLKNDVGQMIEALDNWSMTCDIDTHKLRSIEDDFDEFGEISNEQLDWLRDQVSKWGIE